MMSVDEQERRDRLTEALDEARQGMGIDHAEVVAWADALNGPSPLPMPELRR
jgi:predicted transcriptional regulator